MEISLGTIFSNGSFIVIVLLPLNGPWILRKILEVSEWVMYFLLTE